MQTARGPWVEHCTALPPLLRSVPKLISLLGPTTPPLLGLVHVYSVKIL